jgi:multidrug efflux pump subunit AcrA (membrane-fusion protein)
MKSRHKVFIIIGIIILVTGISVSTIIAAPASKERKIKIGAAYLKNFAQVLALEGTVEPNRKQIIDLDTAQKVVEVFVGEGQDVKKGDQIVKLDSSDNQHRLKLEEINLSLAQNELKKVQNNEKIDKDDLEYSLLMAKNAMDNVSKELEKAKLKLAGDKKLYESGAISKFEYDEALDGIKKLENTLSLKDMEWERAKNAFDNYDLSKQDKIFELKSNIRLIEENINNLKSKVDADTMANIDGKIVKLDIQADQYPSGDNSQILIYDMSKYIIDVQVRQRDALYIQEGMKTKIKVKGLTERYMKAL